MSTLISKIFVLAVIAFLFILSSLNSNISADHCPADYQHLNVVNACVSLTHSPSTGCANNEQAQQLLRHDYCVLTGPPAGAPVIPPPGGPGNILPARLPDSPATGFTAGGFVGELVSKILPIVLGLGGFATVIIIVISGIQFVTSSGNPEAAAAARGRLMMALVGFVIIILAFAITQIIDTIFLGGSGIF